MESWIYFFSRFTPEALIVEGLILFSLIAIYAAYWILKKRKYGVANAVIPAGLVKLYLSELIGDAEHLRGQLFGLLKNAGVSVDSSQLQSQLAALSAQQRVVTVAAPGGGGGDDALWQAKIADIEAKMQDQSKAMEVLISEKTRLEQELESAKAGGGGGSEGGSNDQDLLAKIKALEARLAEYSVIEDDLANLKRLQQENAQLKSQLASGGGSGGGGTLTGAAAAGAAAAVIAAEATAPSVESAESLVDSLLAEAPGEGASPAASATPLASLPANGGMPASESVPSDGDATADDLLAALSAPESAGTPPPATPEPDPFDSLVAETQNSVDAIAAAPVSAEGLSEVTNDAAQSGGDAGADLSDADLLAEFEKMLNS